jgi:hypothetical protein
LFKEIRDSTYEFFHCPDFHCLLLIFNEKDSNHWAMDSRQWAKNCYRGLTSRGVA